MKVIVHQRICKALGAILLEPGLHNLEESRSIDIITEDRLLSIATRGHVVDRAAKSNPMLSRHEWHTYKRRASAKPRKTREITRTLMSDAEILATVMNCERGNFCDAAAMPSRLRFDQASPQLSDPLNFGARPQLSGEAPT
jgi:hypothetical protein